MSTHPASALDAAQEALAYWQTRAAQAETTIARVQALRDKWAAAYERERQSINPLSEVGTYARALTRALDGDQGGGLLDEDGRA